MRTNLSCAPALTTLAVLALTACASSSPYEPNDPLEPLNRKIYGFNIAADKYVLRPVAVGYDKVTPEPVKIGVDNFFDNLFYPTTIVNDFLQGKVVQGGQDTGRFVSNTLFGFFGLVDVASKMGMPEHDEDFGQTLANWGVGDGWYLMLPLLGPSTNRDAVGRVGDYFTRPTNYMEWYGTEESIATNGVNLVETRAKYLSTDSLLQQQLDPYVFVRTAYLQRRQNLIYDGNPPEPDLDIDLPDDE